MGDAYVSSVILINNPFTITRWLVYCFFINISSLNPDIKP